MTILREEPRLTGAPPLGELQLRTRLELLFEWYKGMVWSPTGRLLYQYDPIDGSVVPDGNPIRDIAAVRDVGALSRFLGKPDLLELIDTSIAHYRAWLVPHGTGLVLDSAKLGEPSGVAHSALFLLAVGYWDVPERDRIVSALAEAILHQQRKDGSFRVYFGGQPDDHPELHPGAAMLALAEAARITGDARFREAAARGLAWARAQLRAGVVDPALLVFCAGWQAQAAGILCADAGNVPEPACDQLFTLQEDVIRSGFYRQLDHDPLAQSTVEVASAVEGLNEALAHALRIGDHDRVTRYGTAARTALTWLAESQCTEGATERESGGYGYSPRDRTQRVDVAGHVAHAFMGALRNGIGEEPET